MRTVQLLLLVSLISVVYGQVETAPTPVAQVAIALTDGSIVKGQPKFTELTVESTFGRLAIPLEKITVVALQHTNDETSAVLTLRNGDHVTGRLTTATVGLQACFGPVKVPLALAKSLHFSFMRVAGQGGGSVPKDGNILYYSFDNGDAELFLKDESGGDHDGQNARAVRSPDGKRGGALRCDGDQSFVASAEPFAKQLRAITLAAWINPTGNQYAPVMEFSRDDSRYGPHLWTTQENGLYVNFGSNPGDTRAILTGHDLIPAEKWSHVACTYDGQRGTVYINGAEAGTQAFEDLPLDTRSRFFVGARQGWNANNPVFRGLIDEVLIYDRALTPEEIKQLTEP